MYTTYKYIADNMPLIVWMNTRRISVKRYLTFERTLVIWYPTSEIRYFKLSMANLKSFQLKYLLFL